MIELVTGRSGTGKSEYVLEGIRQDLAGGRKIWLIVPEQQEIVWNARAARRLPPDAFLHLEVGGFSRLAEAVFRQSGGLCYHYISSGGKALVMWKAILSVREQLRVFGRHPGREDRYVPALADAVREMKTHRISPRMIGDAAAALREGTQAEQQLADRLDDLSLIAAAYEAMIREEYDDSEDTLGRLADTLAETDFFRDSIVYVDSYYSVTPVQAEILGQLFRQAEKVVMTFSLERNDTGEQQWGPSRRYFDQMRGILARQGKTPKLVTLTENHRAGSPELRFLEQNLWRYGAEPFVGENRAIRTIRTADRYEEADAAACRVLELVQGGARYGEIAVIARNMDSLRGIADAAMAALGIPYYVSERTEVGQSPAARLLFGALAVCEHGWQRSDVLLCAKTGLCSLSADECDALERYAEKWKLRGRRTFTDEDGWCMNPDGYTETLSDTGRLILREANDARQKLAAPLDRFVQRFEGGIPTVEEICRSCVCLLTDFQVYEQLEAEAASLEAAGQTAEASRTRQVWNALCDAFDTMVSILREQRCDAGGFARLLRRVIASADVGTIPSGVDEVVLGSADKLRPGELRHVILLGAVEGEFPAAVADAGFFSDADKVRLETAGIILSENSSCQAEEELLRFYRCVCAASDSVTVVIPRSSGVSGEELRPSSGALRIETLFPDAPRPLTDAFFVWNEASAREAVARLSGTPAGTAVRELLAERGIAIPEPGELSAAREALSPETAEELFGRRMTLTQSRLEKFVTCRFSYYCQYLLHLDEDRPAEIGPSDVGNLVHAILERFFRTVQEKNLPLPLPSEEADALCAQLIREYRTAVFAGVPDTPRLSHLLGRLHRNVRLFLDVLSEEFAQSDFRPYRFEQKVESGREDAPPPLEFDLPDGTSVSLRGTIDRLDVCREGDVTYIRVVDYKTGSKKFRLEDVALGLNMQMLLYLFSVWKMPDCTFRREMAGDTEIVPAGVLYFSARPGETLAEQPVGAAQGRELAEKDVCREGILLEDPEVLRAMDRELKGKYIPVTLKQDGTVGKTASVASLAKFGELYGEVADIVRRIAGEMKSGDAAARPLEHGGTTPCTFCRLGPVCRRTGCTDGETDD